MDSLAGLVLLVVLILFVTGCLQVNGGKLNVGNAEGYAQRMQTISGPKLYLDSCHRGYPCLIDGPGAVDRINENPNLPDVFTVADLNKADQANWAYKGGNNMGISPAMSGTVYREQVMLNCRHKNPSDCDCGKVSDLEYLSTMHGN